MLWHADPHYWPLSNGNAITAWIPLQTLPVETRPLTFGQGSHRLRQNRRLAIRDASERQIERPLKDYPVDALLSALGDISFHREGMLPRGEPNRPDHIRAVMTVIMMEDGIRAIEPRHPAQTNDWHAFMPGIR